MVKRAYLIENIEEYGKLISYCINKDVSVFRTYWDDRQKGQRFYFIDWEQKRCCYFSKNFWDIGDYKLFKPEFVLDAYGNFNLVRATEVIL